VPWEYNTGVAIVEVNSMAWQKFTEPRKTFRPALTIWKSGQIGLNDAAVRRFALKDYAYAVLYYDGERSAIGILPTNDRSQEGAVKIVQHTSGASIAAKSFVDCFGLNEYKGQRNPVERDEESGMLVADLSGKK
jgi:hypothetical protein